MGNSYQTVMMYFWITLFSIVSGYSFTVSAQEYEVASFEVIVCAQSKCACTLALCVAYNSHNLITIYEFIQ